MCPLGRSKDHPEDTVKLEVEELVSYFWLTMCHDSSHNLDGYFRQWFVTNETSESQITENTKEK